MKPRTIAILLALFTGGVGGQWFYLDSPIKGLVSLFFFWTTVPTWIALYHVVKFALMKDLDFEVQYNK